MQNAQVGWITELPGDEFWNFEFKSCRGSPNITTRIPMPLGMAHHFSMTPQRWSWREHGQFSSWISWWKMMKHMVNPWQKWLEATTIIMGGNSNWRGPVWCLSLGCFDMFRLNARIKWSNSKQQVSDQLPADWVLTEAVALRWFVSNHFVATVAYVGLKKNAFRIVRMSKYVKVSSVLWGCILDWVPDWVWTEGGFFFEF